MFGSEKGVELINNDYYGANTRVVIGFVCFSLTLYDLNFDICSDFPDAFCRCILSLVGGFL